MQLVFTTYLDRHPADVAASLGHAIPAALDAAALRIEATRTPSAAAPTEDGVIVCGGVDVLDGTAIRCEGTDRLTTLSVVIPWLSTDAASGKKLLAANRFVQILSSEALAA